MTTIPIKIIGQVIIWKNPEVDRYGATIFGEKTPVAAGYNDPVAVEKDLERGYFARGLIGG